jgi:Glycosyl transferase family 2
MEINSKRVDLLNSLNIDVLFKEIISVLPHEHEPNNKNTWLGLEAWIGITTEDKIYDVDVRATSSNAIFYQNLYDFGWNESTLLAKKNYPERHKIIVYICDFTSPQLPQTDYVEKIFLISNYWQSIKHIYLPITNTILVDLFKLKTVEDVRREQKKAIPLISVITVVFNGKNTLEQTIQSVINQTCSHFEYIVVDGGSTDGTVDIIGKYDKYIERWISEKDCGIYDAMNKGIKLSKGEWLIFMNCGDLFVNNECLEKVPLDNQIDFYYSDTILFNGQSVKIRECSHKKKHVIHQSIVYQKKLHDSYSYLVHKGLTISDYLFFRANDNKKWQKLSYPISLYNTFGVSTTGSTHSMQKAFVDFLQGDLSYFGTIARILEIQIKYYIRKMLFALKISYLK